VYYIPLYFNFVHGDSSVDAAVRLLPFICVTIFFIMLNGALMPKFGYYMPWYLVSGIFLVIGGATMYALTGPNTPVSHVYGFSILAAVGAGAAQQAAYSIAQAKVPVHRIADAVGFINSAQIGAPVIALTITGAVFQNIGFQLVSNAVAGLNFTPADIHAALAGAKSDIFASITPEVSAKVIQAIVTAISDAYALIFVAGAVNILVALFMKREKLFMEVAVGA
jgi:Major Facilitator Superfamily